MKRISDADWNRVMKRFRKEGTGRFTWSLGRRGDNPQFDKERDSQLTVIGTAESVGAFCEANGYCAECQHVLCGADLNNTFAVERGWFKILDEEKTR